MFVLDIPGNDADWLKHSALRDVATVSADLRAIPAARELVICSDAAAQELVTAVISARLHTLIDRHVGGGRPLLAVGSAAAVFFDEVVGTECEPLGHWPDRVHNVPGATLGPVADTADEGADESADAVAVAMLDVLRDTPLSAPAGTVVRTWSWPDDPASPTIAPRAWWTKASKETAAVVALVRNGPLTAVPCWPDQAETRAALIEAWYRSVTS